MVELTISIFSERQLKMEFKNYHSPVKDFTDLQGKLSAFKILLSNALRTLQKQRNIGKYPHQSYSFPKNYRIRDYIETFDADIYITFCNIWTSRNIVLLEGTHTSYIFSHKVNGAWKIVSINISKFNEIFPVGIPTTNYAFQKWINYIGWKAKCFYYTKASQESEWDRLYGNDVKQFKQLAHLLYESGVNVDELLKEVKNV